jgi:hypothetical protein
MRFRSLFINRRIRARGASLRFTASPGTPTREERLMNKIQTLLIGSALAAIASTSAFAQTAQPAQAESSGQMSAQMQGAPGVTPKDSGLQH